MAVQQEDADLVVARRVQAALPTRLWRGSVSFCARKPLGAFGAFIVILMVLMAFAAPVIAGDPKKWHLSDAMQGPSATYWLGTNDLGQDMWAMIVYGARISLYVGFVSVALGSGTGGLFGLASAYYGGKADIVVQRLMDALMAIPTLVLALAIMAVLGQSLNNVVIAIAVTTVPRANRIVRSQALAVTQAEYVMAARAIGAKDLRIMVLHVFPQCVAPWLIIATAGLGGAIVAEASLSFLGMGVPPTVATWGGMLSTRGREFFVLNPWMAIWPGVAISLAVYGFNLFGDAIRDVLDPRLRGT